MSNMQAFHKWLSSTEKPQDACQRCLRQLTRASRNLVISLQGDITWAIWSAA
ncbi:MAG: hypothetical protein AB1846_13030 [Chloroflexota bacterium]